MRHPKYLNTLLVPATSVLITAVIALCSTGLATAAPARPAAPDTVGNGPVQTSFPGAFAYSLTHPEVAPPGANDFGCKPSAEHPRPVVLVHGTWVNQYASFARLSPALRDQGYCVFTPVHGKEAVSAVGRIPGVQGTDYIDNSSQQVATFVDRVLAATGAPAVDMVGYSLGGPTISNYLRFFGGADPVDPAKNKVRTVVTLGATTHGTSLSGIGTLAQQLGSLGLPVTGIGNATVGFSIFQELTGSAFLTKLTADGDTERGISYTAIGTSYDQITTPYTSGYLTAGPDAVSTNIRLQQGCESDFSDHLALPYSVRAMSIVSSALARDGVPDSRDFACTTSPPVFSS